MNKSKTTNIEEKILDVAKTLFIKQGFDKTTTAQIAKLAGCNQAMLHYYYRTKEKLFNQIFEKQFAKIIPIFMGYFASTEPLEIKIKNIIETHFSFLAQNQEFIPFVFNEVSTHPERFMQLLIQTETPRTKIIQQLETALNREIKNKTIKPMSVMDLIMNILTLNIGFFLMLSVFKKFNTYTEKQLTHFIMSRKEETIRMVLDRLKP